MSRLTKYLDTNPTLRPYYLMWLRRTTKTINKWPEQKFINGVMDCYERRMGYRFDIHHPVLFTEKLQWYKVFYKSNDFGRITDKYRFKDYVRERLGEGYTIPCFGAWDSYGELKKNWADLPEEFVLKANLQSDGRNIKIIHHKSEVDLNDLSKELKRWLKPWHTLLNSWDWHFYNSTPKILAEQYMSNFKDQLFDYKFFCFDGEPYCMYVAQEHFDKENYPISFYDLDWNLLNVKYGNHEIAEAMKPKQYEQMIEIPKKLSKGWPFVRVDFFDTDEHLYVAELTFAPGGGCTPYNPVSFNEELGKCFKVPL